MAGESMGFAVGRTWVQVLVLLVSAVWDLGLSSTCPPVKCL